MKKTLLIALAAIATIFTSCSSDIINDNDDSNNGQGKGMTLIANVEQDDTRATLDTKETFGTWRFAYTDNDKVEVGNDQINNYYTFTKSGENFSCADAKATSTAANWYAYYPSTNIDLTNQDGKADGSAAKLYALAGATETATTGAEGLTINMKAKAAVLRIVKVDNYGPCDIYIETTGGYVKGLKAKKNGAGFDVVTSDDKVSVFKVANENTAGIYYVIVPAGVPLKVYNDGINFKTTSKGLKAGKYYTLTSGPTTGTATAKLTDGTTEKVEWVQLWIGGPRFATKNVAKEMTWFDATETGSNYVWGSNWRTPAKEELAILDPDDGSDDGFHIPTILDVAVSTDNGVQHFKYTGTQPGYKTNNMLLPFIGNRGVGTYWTSTKGKVNDDKQETGVNYNITDAWGPCQNFFTEHERHIPYVVRPVLTIQTVKWKGQDIE